MLYLWLAVVILVISGYFIGALGLALLGIFLEQINHV